MKVPLLLFLSCIVVASCSYADDSDWVCYHSFSFHVFVFSFFFNFVLCISQIKFKLMYSKSYSTQTEEEFRYSLFAERKNQISDMIAKSEGASELGWFKVRFENFQSFALFLLCQMLNLETVNDIFSSFSSSFFFFFFSL